MVRRHGALAAVEVAIRTSTPGNGLPTTTSFHEKSTGPCAGIKTSMSAERSPLIMKKPWMKKEDCSALPWKSATDQILLRRPGDCVRSKRQYVKSPTEEVASPTHPITLMTILTKFGLGVSQSR